MDEIENISGTTEENEKVLTLSVTPSDTEIQGWDAHNTKRLLRKMDWHIIPFMSLIYL